MTEQLPLGWSPPAVLLPQVNPTAPRERRRGLQRKCLQILERLRQGPATNVELFELIGGIRGPAPRIHELRKHLRKLYGRGKEWEPIPCVEDKATGIATYRLAPELAQGQPETN